VSCWQLPIVLASASPRRAQLLAEAGIEATISKPTCDDGLFTCGTMEVQRWVQVLAVLKAMHVIVQNVYASGTVLAADTVCVVDDSILGQPKTIEDARAMLHSMTNRTHDVYTGWCLASVDGALVHCEYEKAEIEIGCIEDHEIEKYLLTNHWAGKAGGYNLSERVHEGWPIICSGDPSTVMGLPMDRLKQELSRSCI
jgi:septum formation protein